MRSWPSRYLVAAQEFTALLAHPDSQIARRNRLASLTKSNVESKVDSMQAR